MEKKNHRKHRNHALPACWKPSLYWTFLSLKGKHRSSTSAFLPLLLCSFTFLPQMENKLLQVVVLIICLQQCNLNLQMWGFFLFVCLFSFIFFWFGLFFSFSSLILFLNHCMEIKIEILHYYFYHLLCLSMFNLPYSHSFFTGI